MPDPKRTPALLERRLLSNKLRVDLEVRAGEPSLTRLVGHSAMFNVLSEDLGGFREKVMPGAFAASIAADDVRCLFNHDPNFVLGRSSAGTLKLAEDELGLAMGCDLPDTQAARDLATSISRGDITGQSIGFETLSDEWNMVDGETVRTILAVKLWDVSPVTFPAYPQTDVAMRSLEAWKIASTPPAAPSHLLLLRRRLELID